MTQTTASDLIVPDVWGDAVMDTVLGKSVMLPLAATDDTLVGQPGDSVDMPFWAYIGDADALTEGVAMTPVAMSMTSDRATIVERGKAIELTDTALLTALGNPNDQARTQLALSIARRIDTDLRVAAVATHTSSGADDPYKTSAPLTASAAAVLSWSVFVDGTAAMGDDYDPNEMGAFIIHSKQRTDIMKDSQFTDVAKFGPDAVTLRGEIGKIGNVPVLVSDRTTVVSGSPDTYKSLIIAKGSLALKYKRRAVVEADRDILARTNIITTNIHYAAKRVNDRGVVVLTTR